MWELTEETASFVPLSPAQRCAPHKRKSEDCRSEYALIDWLLLRVPQTRMSRPLSGSLHQAVNQVEKAKDDDPNGELIAPASGGQHATLARRARIASPWPMCGNPHPVREEASHSLELIFFHLR